MKVLSTRNLHKQYGHITAVNKLNLDISEGTVFGLLGPNGSGKTTTLGMILGVTRPTSGDFLWFDQEASHEQRKRVGSILEKPNFYPNFSAFKNLQLACLIKEAPESRIDEVLEQVGLLDRKYDPFRTYSLGMKQRLAIGSALLAHPEVLILDEPTNGLDPKGIAEIRQLIIDIAQSGKTIILASHLLDEVQKVCSEFCILQKGSLIYTGRVDADFSEDVLIEISSPDLVLLVSTIQKSDFYRSHRLLKDKIELKCQPGTSGAQVNKFLVESGIYANHIQVIKKNLEQQFMEILSDHA
jgi:ABC-2 type transport system ATP-binding protein